MTRHSTSWWTGRERASRADTHGRRLGGGARGADGDRPEWPAGRAGGRGREGGGGHRAAAPGRLHRGGHRRRAPPDGTNRPDRRGQFRLARRDLADPGGGPTNTAASWPLDHPPGALVGGG